MLRSMKELEDYALQATDGEIGHVRDFFFDDKAWVIRYFVVDTGTWLSSPKVLISPVAVGHPNWAQRVLPVSITMEQVRSSPDIDTECPVSRQHEMQYLGYYGYPYYWDGAGLWGMGAYPSLMMTRNDGLGSSPYGMRAEADAAVARAQATRHRDDDPHLRSCQAVTSYRVHAIDGEIGHVAGLLVDEESRAVRYLIVNTSNWWLGHEVLIAPQWIDDVNWMDATVRVNLSRQAVQAAPPYDSAAVLDRQQEVGIYQHYGRAGYWAEKKNQEAAVPID